MEINAKVKVQPGDETLDEQAKQYVIDQIWRCCGMGMRVVAAVTVVVFFALTMIDLGVDYWAWLRQ